MRNQYTLSEFIKNTYAFIMTKLFYKGARLIRYPFFIRGKSGMKYGKNLTTGHSCRFDLLGHQKITLFIGENCEMGDNVHIVAHEKVNIGNNVLMASKIFISDTSHGQYENIKTLDIPPNKRPLVTAPVVIGNNVWIGENVCVLPGISVGNGVVIGANAVVTHDIPDKCVVAGNPAKVIKSKKVAGIVEGKQK